jgi:sporulation protein YlmC with PRC-barrel domain
MRKTLLTTGALVALMISPALTQDAYQPAQPAPAPEAETMPAPDLVPVPEDELAAEDTMNKPKFIAQQETTELLASSLLGATVYSPTDETLGDISDLVFNEDTARIEAVIVGVGGFLGIGKKNVAVSYDAIMETTDTEGNIRLVLDTTAEELEAAPGYMTVADLQRQLELERIQQLDTMTPPPAMN